MQTVTLKKIEVADFRKSEATLYDDFAWRNRRLGGLKKNEVILFISLTGNQCIWIINVTHNPSGRRIVDSRRWRVEGGVWNPLMIANYAEQVGLRLKGIKKFEEYFTETTLRKKGHLRLVS